MTITNKNYRKFLDEGLIDLITTEQLELALRHTTGIRGKFIQEGRCLLIALYYSGARPAEILEMEARDIVKEKNYITMKIKTLKRGLPRTIWISQQRKGLKELYNYSRSMYPQQKMFFHYKGKHEKTVRLPSGEIKVYIETSYKVQYYIKKWFSKVIEGSITPYYLRHSRMSSLSEKGATPVDLKYWKGARSVKSVDPYLHLNPMKLKSLAKKVV